MSKVDTLRHAVDYIEKLQTILKEQQIDINVSTCGRKSEQEEDDSCKSIDSSSSVASSIERNSSSQNTRSLKLNNRTKNGRNGSQRENKPIASKSVSRANLPPPLIMLPKTNQQQISPYHHSQHPHQQQSPPTPSSHSSCSSPVVNSPLLGPNHQSIMHFNQSSNLSSNHQNYRPPLTPRTPSNSSSGNINTFCQFIDGSPSSGAGNVPSPSIITNESGYDSMSASFYNSPTSPPSQQQLLATQHPQIMQQSPMRQIMEQNPQNLPSPMGYHQNYQQGYQVPCTPPGKWFSS